MVDFDQVIRKRRSVRGYDPKRRVPAAVLNECLELAQQAPSNCNVQPWRVFVASGEKLDSLREKLTTAFTTGTPSPSTELPMDTFEGVYRDLQVECAKELYGKMGVPRDDQPARFKAHARNFAFFGAPHAAIVCMHKSFGLGVALDVGMWVQTFMLVLASRGIGSCPQASLRAYPEVIRQELAIPDDLHILCGVSFGYEDAKVAANQARMPRSKLSINVKLRDA